MTAPAEEPRGGEEWWPVCGCEQGMGHMDRGCHSYGLCHVQSAERAARSAGDRAQPTQELREAIVGTLMHHSWCWIDRGQCTCRTNREQDADALLVGPLAALLDAQAAVGRVEALHRHMGRWREGDAFAETPEDVTQMWSAALRRALDGTT